VLPRLSLSSSSRTFKRGERTLVRLTFRVTDVGDAVRGARVSVAGQSRTTNTQGKASLLLRATGKRVAVHATKDGYAPATTAARR
jgi:hypothetical protein